MSNYDSYLRGQVADVKNMLASLDRSVDLVQREVAQVGTEQAQTRSELARLRQDFADYVQQAKLRASLQQAETRVGALQGQLEYEFGHHKVVRRSAVGILQAFDVGLVSEEAVRSIGEELMIQSPRYWLAPVLVALAAWAGDEEDLCRRAVEEAFRRSSSRTCLFMALVLRRQGRRESAVRWLKHYLDAQDPAALGRDFAVILESISQGAFGPSGLELVQGYLDRWRALLATDETVTDAQVARWRVGIESHTTTSANAHRFPRLSAVSPQWPQLLKVLSAAQAQQSVLDTYQAMFAEEFTPSERLEDAVDDILDRLVEEYDTEELPLRRELAYNEAIIEHGGDVDAARRVIAADSASREATLDYLTIQTTSALNPDAIGVSRPTQRLAVGSCHDWFARAHALHARDYRAAVPADVQAAFESSHNVAAKAFSLPRWTGSLTTTPIEQLERSLSDHWDRHTAPFVASLAFDTKKWIGPIATFLGIFILLGACAHTWGVAFVLALIAGGIWALAVNNQRQAASKRQAEAREFLARAKHDSTTQLRAARGELTDWHAQYAAADAVEPTLAAFIQALPAQARAPLPYESRGLTGVGATGSGGTYEPPPARDLPTQPGGYDSPASSYPNS